jgi:hypothetical protein
VYCVDWDNYGRAETLQILDTNNNVLDTRNISSFTGGVWVVWNLSGHIQLRITLTGGINAVLSGIFFGGGGAATATVTAQFVKLDTSTQGSWQGVYGSGGYNVIGNSASYPSYITPVPRGNSTYIWAAAITDIRGLQTPGGNIRTAGTWYSYSQFMVDLPLSGPGPYQMAVSRVNCDNYSRAETLQILDANNNVLDTSSISNFTGGVWAVWNLSGHIRLLATLTSGINAVISGIFFHP